MRLEWSAFAIEDRDGILDYIEEDGPHAAVVVDDRIRAHVRQPLQFPETGRPGRIEGIRDWSSAEHRILHVSIVKERISVFCETTS
ncbi:type II toxin-antitoxin system RelE/ParE family toxin [Caballeronia arvi]|uniref:type II toxin-antitoxin system RelE/ParE family toxin n=1 Tax=Caballeronia arvi TaxID=1777135 RepID=UPI000B050F9B|nr:type II toxin-antitoxin system RelE/ParE family toxin [Caballeronia arvi]